MEVEGIDDATALAAGWRHTCAIVVGSEKKLMCWGRNSSGQLGNGTTSDSPTPVEVEGIDDATALAAGSCHTCALVPSGQVTCWGCNPSGQLGDGTTSSSMTPVEVEGIDDAIALAAGECYTCAVVGSGRVRCWGCNSSGQLGNGTTSNSPTPVEVEDIQNAVALAAGEYHTCAVESSGRTRCWGRNQHGQLGDGTTSNSPTPVDVAPSQNDGDGDGDDGYMVTIGSLDEVTHDYAIGWTCDPDRPQQSIQIHLYFGGPAGVAEYGVPAIANHASEQPIADLCGGGEAHGFSIEIDANARASLLNGDGLVYAYGIDVTGNGNPFLTGSPKAYPGH